jgi:hypothetical protein
VLSAAAATAVAMLVVLVGAAAPASAGGPTSVIVVQYAGSRAAAALTGSPVYADLERALSPYDPPRGERTATASFMGTTLRLTWLIHDVTPWRIDGVVIDGNEVWVETAMSTNGTEDLFSIPSVRHRPADSALLLRTLRSLGVLGDAPQGAAAPSRSTATPATASAPATGTAGLGRAATAGLAGLALLVGVVTGLAGVPTLRRLRSPRHPSAAGDAGAPPRPEPVGFSTDPDQGSSPRQSPPRPSLSGRS